MVVTPCTRCTTGWDKKTSSCKVETGVEHMPLEKVVPDCPIQDRCQHQLQSSGPCVVRARGMVCESALIHDGLTEEEAMAHPLSFHAMTIITEEELADYEERKHGDKEEDQQERVL